MHLVRAKYPVLISGWANFTPRAAAEADSPPRFSVPAIIAVSVAGAALLLLGSTLCLIHRRKRRDKKPQASANSQSNQPLLYSSNALPREAFTSMSHPDSFFSHVPATPVPAVAYGTRTSTSRLRSSAPEPVVDGPVTDEPKSVGGSHSSTTTQRTRTPSRRTSRWSHLPPIPTIREVAAEEAAQPPSRSAQPLERVVDIDRLKPPETAPIVDGVSPQPLEPEITEAEVFEGSVRSIVAEPILSGIRPTPSDAKASNPTPLVRERERVNSWESSQSILTSHRIPTRTVSKPRVAYARPGRLISGRG